MVEQPITHHTTTLSQRCVMDAFEWSLLLFVALQVGLQSAAVKRFGRVADSTTPVLVENLLKVLLCAVFFGTDVTSVDPYESALYGLLPAAIYAIGGVLKLRGYHNTSGVTFNTLNQTKLVFASLFAYVLLGKTQTLRKLGALSLVLTAAVVSARGHSKKGTQRDSMMNGVVPCLCAAALSGLASAVVQLILQDKGRDSYLYSSEMAMWGSLLLLPSASMDGVHDMLRHPLAALPPLLQSCGGIAIGLLIQRVGGVAYGFSTVIGLMLSALLDPLLAGKPPSKADLVCLPIVVLSTYLYTSDA